MLGKEPWPTLCKVKAHREESSAVDEVNRALVRGNTLAGNFAGLRSRAHGLPGNTIDLHTQAYKRYDSLALGTAAILKEWPHRKELFDTLVRPRRRHAPQAQRSPHHPI